MAKPVTNLTVLSSNNDGVFPFKQVEKSITGKSQVVAHGTIDMPVWGALTGSNFDVKPLRASEFTI
jgi:hypothetical protein